MKHSEKTPLALTNIAPEMVVKNYRALCKLLEQPVLAGDSKLAQLKVFAQYLDFAKVEGTNSFKINNIYKDPLQKFRKLRKLSKMPLLQAYALMLDLCSDITAEYLAGEIITVTRTTQQLHLTLGICNPQYYENKEFISLTTLPAKKQYDESIFAKLPKQHVLDFYKEVDERGRGQLTRLIDNFIKRMHTNYMFEAKKTYFIDTGRNYYLCTDDQHTEIREAVRRTLNLEKYLLKDTQGNLITPGEQDLYIRGRITEFYEDVMQDKWVQAEGIKAIYSTWSFRFTNDLINRLDRYAEIHSICREDVLNELNQKAVKYHDMRTEKRVSKVKGEGTNNNLPEIVIEEWLDTFYRPSRELLKTLIQLK